MTANGNGYTVEMKGDKLVITVDVSQKAKQAAPLSSKGRSKLLASSHGWKNFEGGVSASFNIIHK